MGKQSFQPKVAGQVIITRIGTGNETKRNASSRCHVIIASFLVWVWLRLHVKMSLWKFLKNDSSSDSKDYERLFERTRTKKRLRFRDCDSSSDDNSIAPTKVQVSASQPSY